MTIGELDRRVIIENATVSRNSYGELERAYESFRTVSNPDHNDLGHSSNDE